MSVDSQFETAVQLHQAGRLGEAFALYRQILEADPRHARAWHQLAVLAHGAGHRDLAMTAAQEAVAHGPGMAEYHNTLASLHLIAGRFAEAHAGYQRAVALKPDYAEAHCNLGNVLRELGQYQDAVASLQQALILRPGLAQAWNNLGTVWPDLNRLDLAVNAFRQALALQPHYPEAHNNLGVVLKDQGYLDQAIACYRTALEQWPGYAAAQSNLLFCLCFKEDVPPEDVFTEHLRFDECQVRPQVPATASAVSHANNRNPERRLRVGYVSPDFRLHPGGHFLLPVLECHDPQQIELFCYYSNPKIDALTEAFQRRADHWRVCHTLSDAALAEQITADGIDILVECAGHMLGSRLMMFGRRPAPIQVSYPLYPNTTGVSTLDYRIMDPYFAPPWADAWHSEKLIRLPDAHVCYRPSRTDIEPTAEPPCYSNGFITFGSFNNFAKVGANTVAAWAEILKAVPDAKLMLKWSGLAQGGTAWCRDRFAAQGIGSERLILVDPSPDPYTPYRQLDIALDPLFANGGTTTCDALWMGVPVVTRYDQTPFSRVGLCHLTNIGLPELITATTEAYVATAVWLAQDRAALADVRRGLRGRFATSPLMDAPRYAANLERAYRACWRRWCAGQPPTALIVAPVPHK